MKTTTKTTSAKPSQRPKKAGPVRIGPASKLVRARPHDPRDRVEQATAIACITPRLDVIHTTGMGWVNNFWVLHGET